MAVLYAHVHHPPPPLGDLAPDTPEPLRRWVEWLLAKAPEDRPASAAEAWEALEEIAVAELGPYWRRSAAVLAPPEEQTIALTTEEPTTEVSRDARARSRPPRDAPAAGRGGWPARRRRLRRSAWPPSRRSCCRSPAVRLPRHGAAVPFDFDGDRRQELVVGMPGSARREGGAPGGLVVIHRGDRGATPTVITPRDAGLPAPYEPSDDFGWSPQSGDFDRDGWADLAIGVPGTGARRGPLRQSTPGCSAAAATPSATAASAPAWGAMATASPPATSTATDSRTSPSALPARTSPPPRLGRDRAPLRQPGRPHDRACADDPRGRTTATSASAAGCATGHVNGDRNLDLVEGAPDEPEGQPGHVTFCRGTVRGPCRCQLLGDSGTSYMAVADVTGDGFEDIVQGDHVESPGPGCSRRAAARSGSGAGAGAGLRPSRKTITQELRGVPGDDEAGDSFGFAVDAGDLDGDGYADMVVGAPGENEGAGAVMVIRGARNGYRADGQHRIHARVGRESRATRSPDESLGWSLAIMRLRGDDRPDVVVGAAGLDASRTRSCCMRGGPGAFAPDELHSATPLRLGDAVQDPQIDADPHCPGSRRLSSVKP